MSDNPAGAARHYLLILVLLALTGCSGLVTQPSDITHTTAIEPDAEFVRLHDIFGNNEVTTDQAFAAAHDRFVSQHDYACRRPVYYRYFKDRLGDDLPRQACPGKVPFRLASALEGTSIHWVDPRQVRSIHVLFAGQGENIASRFGHLSFRLVICPDPDASGSACDENLFEHIVLGFRAHVDDLTISLWSGLFGGYRSHLYANRFMDLYEEYAIGEFREVYSLPLQLSQADIERMVVELSDIHWNYAGDYRFLTNNCSTIAQRYLRHSWPAMADAKPMQSLYWRPDRFFSKLRESDLAAGEKLHNDTWAENHGFYFPSTLPAYRQALDLVNQSVDGQRFHSLEHYVAMAPRHRLSRAKAQAQHMAQLAQDHYLLDAQLMLEELSVIRYERRLLTAVAQYFENNDPDRVSRFVEARASEQEFQAFKQCLYDPLSGLEQAIADNEGIPQSWSQENGNNICGSQTGRASLAGVFSTLNALNAQDWAPVERAVNTLADAFQNLEFYSDLGAPDY